MSRLRDQGVNLMTRGALAASRPQVRLALPALIFLSVALLVLSFWFSVRSRSSSSVIWN